MNRDCLYYRETYTIYDDSQEGLFLVKYFFKEEIENLVDTVVNQIIRADMTEFEKVKAAAEEAIGNYFNGNLLGRAVHLSQLYALLYGIEGVENYHILIPTEDVAAENTVLPVLGALSVTQFF